MSSFSTLPELFFAILQDHQSSRLLNYRVNGVWKQISTSEFGSHVMAIAHALKHNGLQKGECVGILSQSSPWWIIIDFAIILAGGITTPIFRRISPENLLFEIQESGINTIFIGDLQEYEAVKKTCPEMKHLITIGFSVPDSTAISLEKYMDVTSSFFKEHPIDQDSFRGTVDPDTVVSVIYTSGSMGWPKGVQLSHANLISQVHATSLLFPLDKTNDVALTSLPFAHIFERMVIYFYLSKGLPIYCVDDLNAIGSCIREVSPTIMTVVPRLLEKMFEKIQSSIHSSSGFRKTIGDAAIQRAILNQCNEKNLMDFIFDCMVYKKIRKSLGGKFRYIVSGSAPLSKDTAYFFVNCGLPLYEGYGLTEASPVIAANYEGNRRIGTVGKAFPNIHIRIETDGEILAKGPNIMKGYLHDEVETAKAIDDQGWLHTGDLGSLSADGYLTITGRKKELMKKSTGEYVPPIPIEQAIARLDIIDYALIIAEGRKLVSCILFPDYEQIKQFQQSTGSSDLSFDDFLHSNQVKNKIIDHIQEVNKHRHHSEEVHRFCIIHDSLSIEKGTLTPTMKIRRSVIEQKYITQIESLYHEPLDPCIGIIPVITSI